MIKDLVDTVVLLLILSITLGTIGYIGQIVEDFIYEIKLNHEIKEMERAKAGNKDEDKETH